MDTQLSDKEIKMFFESAKDARLQARIETHKTGYTHRVVACKKYLCPLKEYFSKDYINGFTLVLKYR